MKFRKANKTDISQLIDMRLAYLSEDYNGLTADQSRMIAAQLPGYFMEHLTRDLFAYVCVDSKLIVSTVFLLVMEKPANPSFLTGWTGTILNVYTLPQYRKRGLAGSLMRLAMQEATCKKLSYLELKATQAGSSLYNKLGFIVYESNYISMKYQLTELGVDE